jgi:SH3-like domain-containing protein
MSITFRQAIKSQGKIRTGGLTTNSVPIPRFHRLVSSRPEGKVGPEQSFRQNDRSQKTIEAENIQQECDDRRRTTKHAID